MNYAEEDRCVKWGTRQPFSGEEILGNQKEMVGNNKLW